MKEEQETTTNITKTSCRFSQAKYHRWEFLLSHFPIAMDIENLWPQEVWVPLTMRQVSSRNMPAGCNHLDTPTVTIKSDVLDFLGYEGPLRSKLGREKRQ